MTPKTKADRAQGWTLRRALAVYGGSFLTGNYSDWAVREAERLEARRIFALNLLGDTLEALGQYSEAADVSHQSLAGDPCLAGDPYAEDGWVKLVRRHAWAGQRAAAREAAERYKRLAAEEFGSAPTAAMGRAIMEALAEAPVLPASAEAAPPARVPAEALGGKTPAFSRGSAASSVSASADALPFWLTRFFGRDEETADLAALLLPPKEAHTNPDLPPHSCRHIPAASLRSAGREGRARRALQPSLHALPSNGIGSGAASSHSLTLRVRARSFLRLLRPFAYLRLRQRRC